jgi:hypothetical protein
MRFSGSDCGQRFGYGDVVEAGQVAGQTDHGLREPGRFRTGHAEPLSNRAHGGRGFLCLLFREPGQGGKRINELLNATGRVPEDRVELGRGFFHRATHVKDGFGQVPQTGRAGQDADGRLHGEGGIPELGQTRLGPLDALVQRVHAGREAGQVRRNPDGQGA